MFSSIRHERFGLQKIKGYCELCQKQTLKANFNLKLLHTLIIYLRTLIQIKLFERNKTKKKE